MPRHLNFSARNYCNLSNNLAHQFAMDHALRIYRPNAIYSFIPKNACSTMRLSLAIENGCIENQADYKWIHENNSTFRADLASVITADYTFVVLRCPYARLASVYLDKVVGAEPAGIKFASMIGGATNVGGVTFDTFVREMQHPVVRSGNVHWRPQSDFLLYKQYDDYFCIEEFDKAISRISDRINMPIYNARGFTGHGLDKLSLIDHGDYSNVQASEIQSMKLERKCPSPHRLYNDKLVSIVNEIFAEDIALYSRHFDRKSMMF